MFGVQLDLTFTWTSDEVTDGHATRSFGGSTETRNTIDEGIICYPVQCKG